MMLHQHGAKIEGIRCSAGKNQDLEPIHIAAKEGNNLIVQYILNASKEVMKLARVKIQNTFSNPLHLTAYEGHFETAEVLLRSGSPLLAVNKFNDTVLHIAIRHSRTTFLKKIIGLVKEHPELAFSDM
jgi:ankyrin repeat protein